MLFRYSVLVKSLISKLDEFPEGITDSTAKRSSSSFRHHILSWSCCFFPTYFSLTLLLGSPDVEVHGGDRPSLPGQPVGDRGDGGGAADAEDGGQQDEAMEEAKGHDQEEHLNIGGEKLNAWLETMSPINFLINPKGRWCTEICYSQCTRLRECCRQAGG